MTEFYAILLFDNFMSTTKAIHTQYDIIEKVYETLSIDLREPYIGYKDGEKWWMERTTCQLVRYTCNESGIILSTVVLKEIKTTQ
jgi:hypothetical protein